MKPSGRKKARDRLSQRKSKSWSPKHRGKYQQQQIRMRDQRFQLMCTCTMYIEHTLWYMCTTPKRYRTLAKHTFRESFQQKRKKYVFYYRMPARALQMKMVTLAEDVKRNATFESVLLGMCAVQPIFIGKTFFRFVRTLREKSIRVYCEEKETTTATINCEFKNVGTRKKK